MQLNPRQRFLNALLGRKVDRAPVANPNTIVTVELQERANAFFPEAHNNSKVMAELAAAGHTICGYDVVFPVFGAGTQEAAALGVPVNWGDKNNLPAIAGHIWEDVDDIHIPDDFLEKLPIKTVIDSIKILRDRFGEEVGIIGKVYGPWSLAYHTFGIAPFLINTIDDPEKVRTILHRLKAIPLMFAKAQIEAGVDALNVCDHITRALVSPRAYPEFLLEIHQEMSREIPCPLILHCCGPTLDRVEYFNQSGMECFNFDSTNDLKEMRAKAKMVLLGHINCPQTLYQGAKEDVRREVFAALEAGVEIIGPECAMPVNAKLSNVIAVREAVDEYYEYECERSEMMQMNSRERVSAALRREEADHVPYCEITIDPALAKKIMGWGDAPSQASDREVNHYTVEEAKAISSTLGLDNICHIIRSPVYAEKITGKDGRLFYGEGKIKTKADISLMQLPDPYDDRLYEGAEQFIRGKEHYSAWFVTRVGLSPTYLSMGFENFSLALHDDRELVESVLDRYFDWAAVVAERVSQNGIRCVCVYR